MTRFRATGYFLMEGSKLSKVCWTQAGARFAAWRRNLMLGR